MAFYLGSDSECNRPEVPPTPYDWTACWLVSQYPVMSFSDARSLVARIAGARRERRLTHSERVIMDVLDRQICEDRERRGLEVA